MTEQLHFHFSLSCIGEGNGNPLQCSCLENPRDGGAWWAAVSGVVQSRTRLKRLSRSSSSGLGLFREKALRSDLQLPIPFTSGHTMHVKPLCSLLAAAAAKLLQSCPTLYDPRDGSPPGSPIPRILQARTLELPFPSPMHESEK